ncbi:MAG: hypothetical protein RL701_4879 [Pseudomonadota bacterium]|jgi:hypothetical protein
MRSVAQLLTILCLVPWPMVLFTSAMAFGSPGAENNLNGVLFIISCLFYPVIFGVLFCVCGWKFLWLSPIAFLSACVVIPVIGNLMFGYPALAFKLLRGDYSSGYTVTSEAVHLYGNPLAGADPKTFAVYRERHTDYAHDLNHVFFHSQIVQAADPSTFECITPGSEFPHWKDRHAVYINGERVQGADPATFRALPDMPFGCDRTRGYYYEKAIDGVDVASFEPVAGTDSREYARDKQRVYWRQHAVFPGVDVSSIKFLADGAFAKDTKRVYGTPRGEAPRTNAISGADPSTFVALKRRYGKDLHRVYFQNDTTGEVQIVEGADADSFEVLAYDSERESDARDARGYFTGGTRSSQTVE